MGVVFSIATYLFCGLSCLAYFVHIFRHDDRIRRGARLMLACGMAAHLGTIGSRCMIGSHPLSDTSGMLSLIGLLIGTAFVLCSYRWRLGVLGAVILPLVLLAIVGSAMTLQHAPTQSQVLVGRLHLTLMALGVTALVLAAAVSLLYLWQERSIKAGRIGALNRRTPAITVLDELGWRLVQVGFPLYTLAVISGVLWQSGRGGLQLRLEHVLSWLVWVIFGAIIAARAAIGLRGRKAALLTLTGVASIVVVMALYIARRVLV